MSTTLLLTSPGSQFKGHELGKNTLHCLHGLQNLIISLSKFLNVLTGRLEHPLNADILGDFDAHVGDCACHMRAQMLWEMIQHFKPPEKHQWIEQAVISLKEAQRKGFELLREFKQKKGHFRGMGFGLMISYRELFDRIGFTESLAIITSSSLNGSDYSDISSTSSEISAFSGFDTPSTLDTPSTEFEDYPKMATDLVPPSLVDDIKDRLLLAPPRPLPIRTHRANHSHRFFEADTWDLDDHVTMVRVLAFCRMLSVHKKATLWAGPPAMIRYRIDPEAAYEASETALIDLFAEGDKTAFFNVVNPKDRVKRTSVEREHETMQVYVSQITADWVARLASDLKLPRSISLVCSSATSLNKRQVTCVSSYASILPIRAEWRLRGTPSLILARRFCAKGYHNIFYRAVAPTNFWDPENITSDEEILHLGEREWFNFERVTHQDALESDWSRDGHFTIIANSIAGTREEFYSRLFEEKQGEMGPHQPHFDDSCPECLEYIEAMESLNFSQLIMHFFGQHDQFPFELSEGDTGQQFVEEKLQTHIGENAAEFLREASEKATEFGTGKSNHVFTIQHAFLELPVVIAEQVKDMLAVQAKPAPFGYTWTP